MTTDPTPEHPSQLRVGSLDYTPGELDTSHLRPEVAEHHQAVAADLIDHAGRCVLDILAATMHHADFTYNVTAELVNNLVTFATDPTPDLCCVHGQQLIERAERILDLLEARHERTSKAGEFYRFDLSAAELSMELDTSNSVDRLALEAGRVHAITGIDVKVRLSEAIEGGYDLLTDGVASGPYTLEYALVNLKGLLRNGSK